MISYKNLFNKFYKKVDNLLLSRIVRRTILKLCYLTKTTKLPYAPEYLQLDITGFCNLQCRMCPQSVKGAIKEKGVMDYSLFKKIVDDAKKTGIFSVLLVLTGEPLLHTKLFEMINYAKKKGMKMQISTNCTLLTSRKSKEIIESGLDEIILSFDTMNRELYEDYRRGADFDKALANIIGFLELRKQMKSEKPFVVMVNLQPYTRIGLKPQIEKKFLETFAKYNVWIMPKYFSNWSGIMDNQDSFSYGERGISKERSRYKLCETIYHRIVVSWDAKVLSCCNDFTRAQIMGDLTRQSIMEVWNGTDFVNLRQKLAEGRYHQLPLCKNCGVPWEKL